MDCAELIFGRTPNASRAGARGRVFFEDALPISPASYSSEVETVILRRRSPPVFNITWCRKVRTRPILFTGIMRMPHCAATTVLARPQPAEAPTRRGQILDAATQSLRWSLLPRDDPLRKSDAVRIRPAARLRSTPEGLRSPSWHGQALGLGSFIAENVRVHEISRPLRYASFWDQSRSA